jgi:hypothetical protein
VGGQPLSAARGVVICIHQLGATVRLEDGSLAAVPADATAAHRPRLTDSLRQREPLWLEVERSGRHAVALPSPARPAADDPLSLDPVFEDRISAYLKSTEEWAPPDRPPPAERHFIRKKRRAAFFEARGKPT